MAKMKKFGTFGGVFTPSILTILGVIMYLRLGWVIGNAGTLITTIGIILIAHIVSVSTGLSISSIATDKKIKSGGIYYILSRSLGFSMGGAIGITLYLATALSISLYLIGFSESALIVMQNWFQIEVITTNHLRLVASIALMVIVTIAYISTSFAIKTQYFILLAIVLSLVSIFLGTSEGKGFDFSGANLDNAPGFAVIFGVFFPAVTGFTAGVAMSGDLKDPKKSIPWGTMLAIVVGLIVYSGLAIFIFHSIPGAELQNNNNALVEFSWIPQLVIAGIWGATLSSALGGILGGPRIIQSMSKDKITPRIFGKGVGPANEPRNALVLTFVLAEAGILIGELNVIAGIVAMFYMAAYMFINLSCFLEKWASPDFRPKFKINIFIPLIGTIAILLLMIQLNLIATLASVVIMGGIFVLLTRKQLELSSGNVWSSVWSSVVKLGLENLDKKPINKRNWEPNILLFSGGAEARPHLIAFSKAVSGKGGIISNFDLIVNTSAKTLFPKPKQAQNQENLKDDIVFYRKQECQNLFQGIEAIASTYGFSGIEPNTILMGWARNTKDPIWFAKMNRKLIDLEYNILYLDYDKSKGFGSFSKIDIWWDNIDNVGDLTLQIAKRILLSNDWSNAEVRILCVNNNHQKSTIEKLIRKQLTALRMDFPYQIINNEVEKRSFYEIVKEHSFDSDLIFMKIPKMKKGEESTFVQQTNNFLGVMGTTLLISTSKSYDSKVKSSLYLENKYDEQRYILDLKSENSMALKLSGYNTLDTEIKRIDDEINKINTRTSNKIYTALADVYSSFYTLLQEKFNEDNKMSAISFLEIKQNLIEDISSNKRFNYVSDVINEAIKEHIVNAGKIINNVPKVIERVYAENDLIIVENESPKITKIKQKLKKKGKEKIKLLKVATSYFNNEYLESLSQHLLFVGISGKAINNCILNWTNNINGAEPINLKSLEENLTITYNEFSTHYLNNLNNASRQMCHNILSTSNSIDEIGISLKKERKTKRNKRKATSSVFDNYNKTWLTNQHLLTNHLVLHIQLIVLQLKTSKSIMGVSSNVDKILLDKTLKTIEKGNETLDNISVKEINKYETVLYQIYNQINVDVLLNTLQSEMETNILLVQDTIDLIAYDDLLNFESNQNEIAPIQLDPRKITKGLIENEIIAAVKEQYQQIINEGRTEINKIENALELLKFTLLDTTENKKNAIMVLNKTKNQFNETAETVKKLKLLQKSEIEEIVRNLKEIVNEETIAKRADDFDVRFKKHSSRILSVFIKDKTEKLINLLDNLILSSKDKVSKSDFEYRTKSIQNPHTKFADFSDKVGISKNTAKKLPFYYNQLFTGKHTAPIKALNNREIELAEVRKAVGRFNEGKNGALLFTGDHLSGKTYLMQNAVNVYLPKHVIRVSAPIEGVIKGTEKLDMALIVATGLQGDSISILKQIKEKSTIVFEDLELWWTRSDTGSECLQQIVNLIKLFGNKHLFVLDCNILFYQHIRQYINIDEQLLATITTSSLSTLEIKKTIINRHHSGGMKFIWKHKEEDKLNTRQINNLFRRITSQTNGNIGMAFYMWLGNITQINKTEIQLANFEKRYLPTINNLEWENMLLQILMHKHISLARLKQVYQNETEDYVNENLQSLIRSGMVVKTASKNYCVSPYLVSFLTKYLQKNKYYGAV